MPGKKTKCPSCGQLFTHISRHKYKNTLELREEKRQRQRCFVSNDKPAIPKRDIMVRTSAAPTMTSPVIKSVSSDETAGKSASHARIGARCPGNNKLELGEDKRQGRRCFVTNGKPVKPKKDTMEKVGSPATSRGTSAASRMTPNGKSAGESALGASAAGNLLEEFFGEDYYKHVANEVTMNKKDRYHTALEDYKTWSREALDNAMRDTVPGKQTMWKVLPTGSYYEKTKIKTANEFDIMLFTEHSNFRCYADFNDCPPLTCRVRTRDLAPRVREKLLCEDPKYRECISPNKFKKWVGETLKKCFSDHKQDCLRYIDVKVGGLSPGVALSVKNNRRSSSREAFDVDMVPAIYMADWPASVVSNERINCLPCDAIKVRGNGYDLVPAIQNEDKLKKEDAHDTLWRLSFSRVEKQVFFSADKVPTMTTRRKSTLRQLKYHMEEIKSKRPDNNIYFISLHLKHSLLHTFSEYPDNKTWVDGLACVIRALRKLISFIKNQNLPHYFIPEKNLLVYRGKNITTINSKRLVKELEAVKNKYVNG